jgi:hypothetical protein
MMANESELERAKRMSGSMNEAVEFLKSLGNKEAEAKWPHESERDRQMREASFNDRLVSIENEHFESLHENAERVRCHRWHATYNAALTGILAREGFHATVVASDCAAHADAAHGKLKP